MIPDVTTQNTDYMKHGFNEDMGGNPKATLTEYLLSIVYMPHSLRMVCLTNLFCWMAHVCYSLYFTDFVGEAVYGGNPQVSEILILILISQVYNCFLLLLNLSP